MINVTEVAENIIEREMRNKILNAQGVIDFVSEKVIACADEYDCPLEIPDIVLSIGNTPVVFSEVLKKTDMFFKVIFVRFEFNGHWRVCYVTAEEI